MANGCSPPRVPVPYGVMRLRHVSETETLLTIGWLPTPQTIHISVSRRAPEPVIGARWSGTRLANRPWRKRPHIPPSLRYSPHVNDRRSS